MDTIPRRTAALELLLLLPAALFMAALVARHWQPLQDAQRIVLWYAGRPWTLWVLLIALPLAVLITGCASLLRTRRPLDAIRAQGTASFVAMATLASGVLLAIVAVHMLSH